jgi:hypothetical protein
MCIEVLSGAIWSHVDDLKALASCASAEKWISLE